MKRFKNILGSRASVALLVTALILSLVLVPAAPGFALTLSLSTVPTTKVTYLLGETVILSGSVNLNEGEVKDIEKVTLRITGPQPLTIDLPVAEGTQDLTSQLPVDGQGNHLGTLSVTVTWDQITFMGYGYGYGSSYKGGSGGGQINYTINYTPPVFKWPPPPAQAPPLNNPEFAFNVPGGGAATATESATWLYDIPGVPGAPAGSTPLGVAFGYDPNMGMDVLYILVDGTANDMLIEVDPYGGYVFNFTDTGVTDAYAVAVWRDDVFVAHGPSSPPKLTRIIDNTGPTTPSEIVLPTEDTLKVQGLAATDGTIFVAYLQTDPAKGIPVKEFNDSGNKIAGFTVPGGPSGGGFKALAWDGKLVGAYSTTLVHFDPGSGFIFGTSTVDGVTEIEGMTFVYDDLFIADGPSAAVYKVTPAEEAGGAEPFPRALASGAGHLYIVVDGSPDKIVKVDATGQKLDEFNAPSGNIESLAFKANQLYMIDNNSPRTLWRVNPSNPSDKQSWALPTWVNEIGGMTLSPDGSKLIAVERWNDTYHSIEAGTGKVVASIGIMATGTDVWPPMGLEAMAVVDVTTGSGKELLGGKWNNYWRIEPQNGSVINVEMVEPGPPWDITGLAVLNDQVYIADAGTQEIYRASMPGAPPPEKTTIGNYTAKLQATSRNASVVESSQITYTIEKITDVQVNITDPAEGDAFTTPVITVKGNVNDPTIASVLVGVQLPTTTLFYSDVEESQSELDANWSTSASAPPVKWQATSLGKKMDSKAWYYGNINTFDYQSGFDPNFGDLDTKTITIGQDTTLTFYTWYETEPGFDWDRKTIQWVTSTKTETIAQIVDFFPPPTGGPFVQPVPGTVYTPQQFPGFPFNWNVVWVPMARFEGGQPTFTEVTLDLSQFAGQTGQIRFKFETMDGVANEMEGWYIDEVTVEGAGFKGETATVGSDLKWQAQFTLAEGVNTISAQATRDAYEPVVTVTDQVTVFKDESNPIVVIDPVTSPTNNPIQTITGSFTELAPDILEMYVNNKLVLTQKSFSTTFSKSISLTEGTNSILVKLTDKGGLVGQDTATIVLDSTGPVVTVDPTLTTAYPTGEVSARANDFFVFQVKAVDAATGIAKVELQTPAEGGGTQLKDFMAVTDIPVAVRNQWGISTEATHLFPMTLPSSAPPGDYSLSGTATDQAGNTTSFTVKATVVSTLSKFNIYLMPDWNLISLPLIPDDSAIATVLAGLPSGALHSVWYYDAAAGTWLSYVPGAATNDLTEMTTGKAYWVKMNSAAFTESDPLAPGLPQTPVPIKLTISGVVLKPGEVPPTYTVVAGWNMVGLHAERSKQVSIALKSLTSAFGADLWGSILEYQNFISFPTQEGAEPEVVLGSFKSLGSSDNMDPGKGYWLFMQQPGTIVP